MKYYYLTINERYTKDDHTTKRDQTDYLFASVLRVPDSHNLLTLLSRKRYVSANIMPSKKEAEEVAAFWNECYKKNGTYAY